MNYAEVAVNAAVNNTFHYHIPDKLKGRISSGHLVRVAFGTAMQPGIVVDLHHELPPELAEIQTKPIIELLDPNPVMTDGHIELALWMSEIYLSSLGACLWMMLPPGLVGRSAKLVYLLDESAQGENETEEKILDALHEKSPQPLNHLKKVSGIKSVQRVINNLAKRNIIKSESILSPPTVRAKTTRTVIRDIPEDDIIETLAKLERAPKQCKIFAHIAKYDYPLDVTDVYEETSASSADLNNLERKGLVQFGKRIVFRDSLADRDFVSSQALQLTKEQAAVWEKIYHSLSLRDNPNPVQSAEQGNPSPALPASEEGADSFLTSIVLDAESVPPSSTGEARRGSLHEGAEWAQFNRWRTSSELWRKLKPLVQQMRSKPTPSEKYLWQYLRKKQVMGIKFRRQQNIERFVVDFFAPDANLIIEVDGVIHQYTQEEDAIREQFLEDHGYQILRFTNQDVMTNINNVIEAIEDTLRNPSPKHWREEQDLATNSSSTEGFRRESNTFLLHGVTGSGKTEIYLYAIAEVLAQGRQAIFLVPEIALTPQTIRRVAERFPNKVAVVHSSLAMGERHDTWQRARRGEIPVIVGTRSALFTPLPDVGLIILDEEHDPSYKHSPPMLPPYYHARDVAEKMAELNDAIVILGSATPDMETYYRAQKGELNYLHMPNRIMGHRQRVEKQAKQRGVKSAYQIIGGDTMTIGLPPVTIVDMRDELKRGNRSMFSRDLEQALNKTVQRGEQAILFLNRRGQASYVFCRDCGYVLECKRCDTPMTYHRHGETMRCHHCNNQQAEPTNCPQCASERIRYFGAGTQQVEQQLYKTFPDVISVRWDRDTASKPEHHEAILARFANAEANVMVGTQMIAKGLDLPMVTLVGVISADPGLALPDFRANERAFQLLTQVAGRAGRGVLGGRVIIQTYNPQHQSIIFAAQHDYEAFYDTEIEARRELGYPPFRRMGRVLVQDRNPIKAQAKTEEIAQQLKHRIQKLKLTDTHLIGPVPCFFSRLDHHYRWQILIRAMKFTDLLQLLKPLSLSRGIRKDSTQVFIEVDPTDIL
jgi:primosomal protein N'